MAKGRKKRDPRKSVAADLRAIAEIMEKVHRMRVWPNYLRVAAKEMAELRWEVGVRKKRIKKLETLLAALAERKGG